MPPEDIRLEITRIKEYFRDHYDSKHALKSPPHITLIPPFTYRESQEKNLITDLHKFSAEENIFEVLLENFNAFPPRVIFVEVLKNDSLFGLFRKLMLFAEQNWNLNAVGERENRFTPHITVAFKDLKKEAFRDAWSLFQAKKIKYHFIADGITLFRHNGKCWEILTTSRFTNK